eukprot:TRINITY_DN7184_c0_g1_i1.p1 TRINITY_DN7184_c0_g1~~TRINITY_DN7184_c0_g1_i1.p1  ORF type:complete len:143 (-),score=11.84 TRINITY_DN7184_c0_g1_i1:67-450(-)
MNWQLWTKIAIWLFGFTASVYAELPIVFLVVTGFYGIYATLDRNGRKDGQQSAYSVFNEGVRNIAGGGLTPSVNMMSAGSRNVEYVGLTNEEKEYNTFGRKVGRNEKCPCSSGKKYKKCCGDPKLLY